MKAEDFEDFVIGFVELVWCFLWFAFWAILGLAALVFALRILGCG